MLVPYSGLFLFGKIFHKLASSAKILSKLLESVIFSYYALIKKASNGRVSCLTSVKDEVAVLYNTCGMGKEMEKVSKQLAIGISSHQWQLFRLLCRLGKHNFLSIHLPLPF